MNRPPQKATADTPAVVSLKISTDDDPRVLKEQAQDDYANHVVPLTIRVGKWQLAMSIWSLLSAMIWLFYGALVASLYGSVNAIIAMVAAVVAYSLLGALFSHWATRTGLNSTLLSRQAFGALGAVFIAVLVMANTVYFAVFESSVVAVAFASYTPNLPIELWYGVVCLAMLPLMLGGVQTFMAKLNGALLPFFYIGLIIAIVVTAIRFPVGSAWLDFEGAVPPEARAYPGWLLGFTLYMGLFILLPTTVDFARFGKVEDDKFHMSVSFGWIFHTLLLLVNGVAGIFLVRSVIPNEAAAETGVVTAIIASIGVAGLVLIVLSQTRINTLNYYQASTNASRVITSLTGLRVPRLFLVAALTVIVFLLMLTNVFSYLERMLGWQAAFMVGWVGVLVTHYVLTSGWRGTEFRAQRMPRATAGLAVWILSAATAIWLEESSAAPEGLSTIAPLVTLLMSVVLYAIAFYLLRPRLSAPAIDIRDEVTDPWREYVQCDACTKSYVAFEMDRDQHSPGLEPLCDACAIGQRSRRFA